MRRRDSRVGSIFRSLVPGSDVRPICRRINEGCLPDGECPGRATKRSCWLVQDAACCPRNDKSRCCYCRVFLAYLDFRETGQLRSVPMESVEDPRFSAIGRRIAEAARDGGPLEIVPQEETEG